MRTLVIDTATATLSVALFDATLTGDAVLIGHDHRAVGRGHAEQLIPAIAALPDGGRAEHILVGCGPGSFTGIRIAIAAARALAFAWQAELKGFDSLALVAAQARRLSGTSDFTIVVEGGHGEWFVADPLYPARSLAPADAATQVTHTLVVGSRAADLVALRGHGTAIACEADAREALALDPASILTHATPLYGRAPDAKVSTKLAIA